METNPSRLYFPACYLPGDLVWPCPSQRALLYKAPRSGRSSGHQAGVLGPGSVRCGDRTGRLWSRWGSRTASVSGPGLPSSSDRPTP